MDVAFAGGPPTTGPNTRSQPTLPQHTEPTPSPTTHHLHKAPLTVTDPSTANALDTGTALQSQASHATAVAGQPRARAPLANHGYANARATTAADARPLAHASREERRTVTNLPDPGQPTRRSDLLNGGLGRRPPLERGRSEVGGRREGNE